MKFNLFKKKKVEISSNITESSVTRTQVLTRYSYQWNEDIPENERDTPEHPSRPFCKQLIELDRLYTRTDIEKMSEMMGYSVWDRKGGDNCRHRWVTEIVLKQSIE